MATDYTAPFLLIRRDGSTLTFDDLDALLGAVSAARIVVADHHVVWNTIGRGGRLVPHYEDWIVRDDHGAPITADWLSAYRKRRRCTYRLRQFAAARHAASLGLPIPYTGHSGGYAYCLRSPQGMSAYRAKAALRCEDYDGAPRPKGKIKLPPNSYDDIPRSDVDNRNWKSFRKTRWKDYA